MKWQPLILALLTVAVFYAIGRFWGDDKEREAIEVLGVLAWLGLFDVRQRLRALENSRGPL